MKKIISLFMAGLLLLGSLSLVGCDLLEQFLGHDDPPLVEGGGDDLPGEADPPKTEILVDQDLKEEIYNGTYETETESPYNGSYYGVGRTLNVVEDPYIEVASGYAKVFDMKKSTLLLFAESLEDENEKKDNKQRIASAGMKFLKILEKLGDLENE